jgi:hypothetical protein
MNEQLFLNGAPVVGFGASEEDERKFYGVMIGAPLLGLVAGTATGAVLGHKAKKGGVVTAIGAVVGGLAGTTGGVALAHIILRASAP